MNRVFPVAIGFPGPCELAFLVLLLLAVPTAMLLLLRGAFGRRANPGGFPVIAQTDEPDGPGKYRVIGVDKNSRADRDETVEAASRANAQVKAELDGIVVTNVTKIG